MRRFRGSLFGGGGRIARSAPFDPGASPPEPPPDSTQDILDMFRDGDPIRVVVIGNSIGCGYYGTNWANIVTESNNRLIASLYEAGESTIGGWVQMLRDYVVGINASSAFVNISGNGWNTNNNLEVPNPIGEGYSSSRGGTFTIIDALPSVPQIALLPLQVNDRTFMVEETFVANTTAIVESLQSRGIFPVIVMENVAGGAGTHIVRAGELADELNIPKIDMYNLPWSSHDQPPGEESWYEDSTHPNALGHEQMYLVAKAWFDEAEDQP